MAERTTYPNFARPAFVVDWQSVDRDGGHQIDWELVSEDYRETRGGRVTVNGTAAQGATSIPVDALAFPLKTGQLLYFGQSQEFARLTADAAEGATSITVEALPQALEDNDFAPVSGSGKKTIPEGTVMEIQSDGKMIPTQDVNGGSLAHGLLASTAVEGSRVAALSGYGLIIGGVVFETLLPEAVAGVLPSALKTALATSSKGFVYREFEDSRA